MVLAAGRVHAVGRKRYVELLNGEEVRLFDHGEHNQHFLSVCYFPLVIFMIPFHETTACAVRAGAVLVGTQA